MERREGGNEGQAEEREKLRRRLEKGRRRGGDQGRGAEPEGGATAEQ